MGEIRIPAEEVVDHQVGIETAVPDHPEQAGVGEQGQKADDSGIAFFFFGSFPLDRKRAVRGLV